MMITSIGWTRQWIGIAYPASILRHIGRASACHSAECYYCSNTSRRQMKIPKLKKCFRGHLWETTRHTLSRITKNRNMLVCVGGGWSWHLCSLFYCWCSWYDVTGCGNLVGWQNLWYGLLGNEYQMLFLLILCFIEPTRKESLLIKSPGWFIFTFTGILPLLIVICFKLFLLRCWKAISEVRH